MSGWSMDSDAGRERMARDLAWISRPEAWWVKHQLRVKTQPWVEKRQFGVIGPHALTTVAINGNGMTLEQFHSLEELVKRWSVD